MKKIFVLFLVASLAACGSSETSTSTTDNLSVDSTLAQDTTLVSDTLVVGGGGGTAETKPEDRPIK